MRSAMLVLGVQRLVSLIRDRIICTASTGYLPIAVSAARTRPFAPISKVLTTSFTSALVGDWVVTIDSNRLVATNTGVSIKRAVDMIRRCKKGIRSIGTQRERSPRSMRISSARWIILSRLFTPDVDSIFQIIFAPPPQSSRIVSTFSGKLANDRAK